MINLQRRFSSALSWEKKTANGWLPSRGSPLKRIPWEGILTPRESWSPWGSFSLTYCPHFGRNLINSQYTPLLTFWTVGPSAQDCSQHGRILGCRLLSPGALGHTDYGHQLCTLPRSPLCAASLQLEPASVGVWPPPVSQPPGTSTIWRSNSRKTISLSVTRPVCPFIPSLPECFCRVGCFSSLPPGRHLSSLALHLESIRGRRTV